MKLQERWFEDDGKLVLHKTHDVTPTLEAVRQLRDAGTDTMGDSKHVGRVPGWMLAEWMKEAGVKWSDNAAMNDVIRKKMLSGEFAALRNWQGSY